MSETYRETLGILVSIKLSTRYNVALFLLTKRLKNFNEIEDVLFTYEHFFQATKFCEISTNYLTGST